MTIELLFHALGDALPTDHGYALYGAVCRLLPELHRVEFPLAIGPISGLPAGGGLLHLGQRSTLRLRLPADSIASLLPLAGKPLQIAGHRLRLGVPQVRSLTPAAALVARLVTIKLSVDSAAAADPSNPAAPIDPSPGMAAEPQLKRLDCLTPDAFLAGVRRKLAALGITGEPSLPPILSGPRAGQPRRRVLRIKEKKVVGYTLLVSGLSAEDSLILQSQPDPANGFSRRKLGCAFFVPVREEDGR
jgi:hypothetical protein